MYFIEKILKIFLRKKKTKINYIPAEIDKCEHLFLPVDSSGEYLACSKCGKVIKSENNTKS